MPLSSASIRSVLAISLFAAFLSCASTPPDTGPPLPGSAEGTIRISGNHPYDRQIVLVGESGQYWLLRTPALEGELMSLEGQAVRVHGMQGGTGSGEVSVEWYELLAPPGRFAAVGTLGAQEDAIVLRCGRSGGGTTPIEVLIEGPLHASIAHYIGFRAWISGERAVTGDGTESAQMETVEGVEGASAGALERIRVIVSEFGVLGPAIPDLDAPHSTLPDSSR